MSFWPGVRSALREFRQPALWLGIWFLGWLTCIVLSLGHPPRMDTQLPYPDKIGHFLAYSALSAWSVMIFARLRGRWQAAFALVLLGIAIELAQGAFTQDRQTEWQDALANTVGVLFGQLLSFVPAQRWLQRLDSRLFR